MNITASPIAEMHYLNYFIDNRDITPSIKDEIDSLVKSIKLALDTYTIDFAAKKLRPSIFNLRMKAIKHFSDQSFTYEEYNKQILELLGRYASISQFSEIAKIITFNLSTLVEINNSIVSKLAVDPNEIFKQIPEINYKHILFLQTVPIPQNEYYFNFINASLDIEMILIIVQENLKNIQPNFTQLEKISEFSKSRCNHYGAYAILLDLWHPTEDERNNPKMNTMVILSRIIESKTTISPKIISMEQLKKTINDL